MRSLEIAVLTLDFIRRGRKRGGLPRGHAAYMRTLKDVRELPNGPPEARFCVGERSMNAHFFTIPPQFKPIWGSRLSGSEVEFRVNFGSILGPKTGDFRAENGPISRPEWPLPHFRQYGSDREIYNDIWLLRSNLKHLINAYMDL